MITTKTEAFDKLGVVVRANSHGTYDVLLVREIDGKTTFDPVVKNRSLGAACRLATEELSLLGPRLSRGQVKLRVPSPERAKVER